MYGPASPPASLPHPFSYSPCPTAFALAVLFYSTAPSWETFHIACLRIWFLSHHHYVTLIMEKVTYQTVLLICPTQTKDSRKDPTLLGPRTWGAA